MTTKIQQPPPPAAPPRPSLPSKERAPAPPPPANEATAAVARQTTAKPAPAAAPPVDAFAPAATVRSVTPVASRAVTTAAQGLDAPATPAAPVTREMTFVYDAGSHGGLTNLQLKGSFDKKTGAYDPLWGGGDTVAMKPLGDGKWAVTVPVLDDGTAHAWQWGVVADGPSGKGQWAVMGEHALSFDVGGESKGASYAPTTYDRMGAQRNGENDASFRFWAPDAKAVSVKVTDGEGQERLIPMEREADGTWNAAVADGWKDLVGKAYGYQVTGSDGTVVDRPDPYAREMQGEQRGLGRVFLDNRTGAEVNPYFLHPDLAEQLRAKYGNSIPWPAQLEAIQNSRQEFMRFEIEDEANHDHANLVLRDETGHQLTKAELLERLGGFDPKMDPSTVDDLRGGKFDDLWSRNVNDDGSIRMVKEGTTWASLVNNPEKLNGLRYELQVWDKGPDGKPVLLHDTGAKDGVFSDEERRNAPNNDPWSNVITASSGKGFRTSVVTDTAFDWSHDAAPRELDHNKWVIEQIHVGSVFGDAQNSQRSSFKEVQDRLSYFKSLGINTLELLPVNEVEGNRDWGYMGANSLAVESSYGFEDDTGKWVSGTEALKMMIDEAHRQGLNVINDVVYNHIGGDENFLWNLDGAENPYFNWATEPGKFEQKNTDWGAMPAYNNPKVKQFLVDHAVAQVEELHFDGLRFDFTEPIKNKELGGEDGWNMLREINRQLHFYNPNVFTAAEQFGNDPAITTPAQGEGKGGAGFDAQWFTEFQHRLVHDNNNPSVIQQAADGRKTNMDQFMDMLINPKGLTGWQNAVTIISDHDEVGNAERTINVADGSAGDAKGLPPQFARDMARFAAGIGLAAPGIPMFFQGDESMAQNTFKWGTPSTWDSGWSWESLGKDWDWNRLTFNDGQKAVYDRLFVTPPAQREQDPAYQRLSAVDRKVFDDLAALGPKDRDQAMLDIARKQTFRFYQDAIAIRKSSPAFDADAAVQRVYTHNDDSVMAFTRKKGDDEYLVLGSLNRNPQTGYPLELPPGQWREVFNSDAGVYGGNNVGNFGATINGGKTQVNVPAGGYVMFERVG